MTWARRWLATFRPLIVVVAGTPLILILAGFGCWQQDVLFTFDNRTDAVLCEYGSLNQAAAETCRAELEPQTETRWGRDCDAQRSRPITMIIAVKQGGRQIYNRTATCGEWQDSDRRFVIEQEGDGFIVTDSLPDFIPSP